MARRIHPAFHSLILATVMLGCASDGIETSVAFDPLTQFPTQATFLWDSSSSKLPADDRIAALDLGPVIEAAAEAEFAVRGYTLSTTESANYLMSYQVASHSWIGADNSRAVGSLSLLLVEAASGRRVWLGIGRAEINVGLSNDERLAGMRVALAKMLKEFPPNQSR
ncbi:MAG: DUF4136 domain-containing protein [Deltaproteobacteria bacterium]|nr:DUF4136 domain-containing protein [Deltaproteobacteria bacterium]MBW2401807.1 DUF4136 domain-containing protein [Deltaproteobacteria bacterium]